MLNKLLVLVLLIAGWQWWTRQHAEVSAVNMLPESSVGVAEPPSVATAPAWPEQTAAKLQAVSQQFQCDKRKYCSEMTSRAEAEFFTKHCPGSRIDGDGDGIPCENDSRW